MVDDIRAPIVIGITGKRDLDGKDEAVHAALRTTFKYLDVRFPDTPKILLSALAAGADIIAAEEAVLCGWQVAAPLPLPIALYTADFEPRDFQRFETLRQNPRIRSFVLPFLLNPTTRAPYQQAALGKSAKGSNPARTEHYEQVGFFIAQHCALLIAVKPRAEPPGLPGGTARIVEFRLRGAVDPHIRDLIGRSKVLRDTPLLDREVVGPVWLLDLATIDAAAANGLPVCFNVLLPEGSASGGGRGILGRSVWLIDQFNRANRRFFPRVHNDPGRIEKPTRRGDAVVAATQIRRALSITQARLKTYTRLSLIALAALFVLAILAFETFVGLYHPDNLIRWAAFVYFLCLVLALVMHVCAQRFEWQRLSENYRAVSEALRVQVAWWEAGLTGPKHRVEQFYLRGSGYPLAHVREGLRCLIDAIRFGWNEPVKRDEAAKDWVNGQILFFQQRIGKRKRAISLIEAISWFIFVGTLAPGLWVALEAVCGKDFVVAPFLRDLLAYPPGMLFFISLVLFFLLPFWWPLFGEKPKSRRTGVGTIAGAVVLALSAGLLLAVGINDLAYSLPHLEHPEGHGPPDIHLMALATIAVPAVAGAIRFVAEKLSLEAEVERYEEAEETFRCAAAELHAIETSAQPKPEKELRRERVIVALGKTALAENDAWIRAHRIRPVEPVLGG